MKYKKFNWVLVAISGILFTLSFIGIGVGFLSFIAFIPYLIFLDNSNDRNCFLPGALFGFLLSSISLYPIIFVRTYAYIGLIIALPLYFGAVTWSLQIIRKRFQKSFYFLLPFFWIGFEYFMTLGQLNFPWFNIGNTIADYYYLIQFADILGVYGLSFLILIINLLIFHAFKNSFKFLFAIFLILILWVGYGVYRDKNIKLQGTGMEIGLVQLNIEQEDKWKPELQNPTIKDYEQQIKTLATREAADLIILPESAIPLYLLHNPKIKNQISNLTKNLQINLITGFPDYKIIQRKDTLAHKFYNSATLIDDAGIFHEKYNKIKLVPFGERIPLLDKIPLLQKLQFGQANFEYGQDFVLYDVDGFKCSVMICFEGVFPELSRKFSEKGADALIVITNDAWFKKTIFPVEHANNTKLRSIENRLPLIRVANTGISYFVSPKGEILRELPLFVKGNLSFQLIQAKNKQKTIFNKVGYLFPRFCAWLFLIAVIYSFLINLFLIRRSK